MGSRGSASGNSGKAYGVRSIAVVRDIKKLANEFKDDLVTDSDVQGVLEGYEFTRGENYENMHRYFESLVSDIRSGTRNSRITEAKKELKDVQKQYREAAKALNYTNSAEARARFDRLDSRRRELTGIIGEFNEKFIK